MTTATPSGASADDGYSVGVSAAERREALREFGARLSGHRDLAGCGRKIRTARSGSSSEILDVTKSCRRKWLCPTCGYTAFRRQAAKLAGRLRSWTANGGTLAFLTLTQSHCYTDDLAMLWCRLEAGWAGLVRGSGWKADRQTYGIRGYIRITEVVHSPVTGWHIHFHVILLLDQELDQLRLNELKASLAKRFAQGLARRGGHAAPGCQHLQSIRPGSEDRLATYCLKGTTARTSADGSRTPIAILDHLESTGEGLELWDEWSTAVLAQTRVQLIPSTRIDHLRPDHPHYSCYIGKSSN